MLIYLRRACILRLACVWIWILTAFVGFLPGVGYTLAPRHEEKSALDLYLVAARLALIRGQELPALPAALRDVLDISAPRQTPEAWYADALYQGRVVLITFFQEIPQAPIPPLGILRQEHLQTVRGLGFWMHPYHPGQRKHLLGYLQARNLENLFGDMEQRQEKLPMPVGVAPDPVSVGIEAGSVLAEAITNKPDIVLGLATGSTPVVAYRELIRRFEEGELDFSRVRTVNLDEYLGVGPENPFGYRYFMNQQLFDFIRRGINDRKLRRWGLARVESEEDDKTDDIHSEHHPEDRAWRNLREAVLRSLETLDMKLEKRAGPLGGEEIEAISSAMDEVLRQAEKTDRLIGPFLQKNRYQLVRGIEKVLAHHHKCLDIRNTHVLNGVAEDPGDVVRAYEQRVQDLGGVDLQVLGVGEDGHIAFNEPVLRITAGDLDGLEDAQKGKALSDKLREFNEFQLEVRDGIPKIISRLMQQRRKVRQEIGAWVGQKVLERYGKELPGAERLEEALMAQRLTLYLPGDMSPEQIEEVREAIREQYPEVSIRSSADILYSRTRVVDLALPTIIANARFFERLDEIPPKALTMGLGTVTDAKTVLTLAYGRRKGIPLGPAVEGQVTIENGASVLRRHPNARILIDRQTDEGIDDYCVGLHGVLDDAETRADRRARSLKAKYTGVPRASKVEELRLYPRTERSLTRDQADLYAVLIKMGALPSGENLLSARTQLVVLRTEEALKGFLALRPDGPYLSGNIEKFTQWVTKLDEAEGDASGRDYVRFYSIASEEGEMVLGMNILGAQGDVLHWQLRRIPSVPAALDRKGISWGSKGVEFNPVKPGQPEYTWAPIAQMKQRLPVPLTLLRIAQRDMKEFLNQTVPQVEAFVLGMTQRPVTFREFYEKYPQAYLVLRRAFPEQSKDMDDAIVLDWNAGDLRSPPAFIHAVLQDIFRHRYMRREDRILDYSGTPVWGEGAGGQIPTPQGPLIVRKLLRPLLEALRGAHLAKQANDPQATLGALRFKEHPIEAFARFLRLGAEGLVGLEPAKAPDTGHILADGAFLFDVDKTLLPRGMGLDDPASAPIRDSFVSLLMTGAKVRIITANTAQKQYLRVLRPLEDLLAMSHPEALANLEMYAGMGTVRLFFDVQEKRFVKDATHTLQTLVPESTARAEHLESLMDMLSRELKVMLMEENVRQIRQGFSAEGRRVERMLTEDVAGPLDIRRIDFGSPISREGGPLFVEWRDGLSATISGEIFRGGVLRQRVRDHLIGEAQKRGWPLEFRSGGETSIDITFQDVTKAEVARAIMEREGISSDHVVYFGDEFGPGGNDFPLTHPVLEGITLVDVGAAVGPKPRGPFRVYPAPREIIPELPWEGERELMYIFSSLDGVSYVEPGQQPKPGVAYTLSLFYRGYPIVVVTHFPHAETQDQQWLITDLLEPLTQKTAVAAERPQALLPDSSQDMPQDQAVTEALHSSLLDAGVLVGIRHPYGNAYPVRLLVQEGEPLVLIRHGHIPKSKLGILGHAWLRGAVVMTTTEKNLFPLDMTRLLDGSPRYESVLAFLDRPLPEGGRSVGEIVLDALDTEPAVPVAEPLWEEVDAARQAMESAA